MNLSSGYDSRLSWIWLVLSFTLHIQSAAQFVGDEEDPSPYSGPSKFESVFNNSKVGEAQSQGSCLSSFPVLDLEESQGI